MWTIEQSMRLILERYERYYNHLVGKIKEESARMA